VILSLWFQFKQFGSFHHESHSLVPSIDLTIRGPDLLEEANNIVAFCERWGCCEININ